MQPQSKQQAWGFQKSNTKHRPISHYPNRATSPSPRRIRHDSPCGDAQSKNEALGLGSRISTVLAWQNPLEMGL